MFVFSQSHVDDGGTFTNVILTSANTTGNDVILHHLNPSNPLPVDIEDTCMVGGRGDAVKRHGKREGRTRAAVALPATNPPSPAPQAGQVSGVVVEAEQGGCHTLSVASDDEVTRSSPSAWRGIGRY